MHPFDAAPIFHIDDRNARHRAATPLALENSTRLIFA